MESNNHDEQFDKQYFERHKEEIEKINQMALELEKNRRIQRLVTKFKTEQIKNSLEAGMYIRFKDRRDNQYIRKVTRVNKNYPYKLYAEIDIDEEANNVKGVDLKNIIQAEYDITDLLECNDLLYVDISPDDWGGIVVPRIAESLGELNDFKEKLKNGSWILKGVVAWQNINNICYWLGEEI